MPTKIRQSCCSPQVLASAATRIPIANTMGGGGSKTHTVYVDRAPTIQQNIEINRAKTAVLNTQAQQEAVCA